MPKLKFTNQDLIYVPWDDENLIQEALQIVCNSRYGEAGQGNILLSAKHFEQAFKGAGRGWFKRLWVLSHGGDGSQRIYSTCGSKFLTAEQLAEKLKVEGFNEKLVPEILIWACYAGRHGGFAQTLFLRLPEKGFKNVRVSGFRGLTGSVQPRGKVTFIDTGVLHFKKSPTDEQFATKFMREGMLTVYPGAQTYSYEV
jgi:hypothetical protein